MTKRSQSQERKYVLTVFKLTNIKMILISQLLKIETVQN